MFTGDNDNTRMEIKRNPSITSLRDPEKSVSSKSVKRLSKKVDQSQLFLLKKGKRQETTKYYYKS